MEVEGVAVPCPALPVAQPHPPIPSLFFVALGVEYSSGQHVLGHALLRPAAATQAYRAGVLSPAPTVSPTPAGSSPAIAFVLHVLPPLRPPLLLAPMVRHRGLYISKRSLSRSIPHQGSTHTPKLFSPWGAFRTRLTHRTPLPPPDLSSQGSSPRHTSEPYAVHAK